jgi:ABC-2 type transport system ATP-binding protein
VVRTYSGGMRRRLDLAASLIIAPPVLFLDEPTTGLDPRSRNEVWDSLRALVAGGTTILLTTQYLDEADHLADRIAVIDAGRLIACGTPARRITVPVSGGSAALIAAVRELDRAGILTEDIALRRPTLGDVFLRLTGTTTTTTTTTASNEEQAA